VLEEDRLAVNRQGKVAVTRESVPGCERLRPGEPTSDRNTKPASPVTSSPAVAKGKVVVATADR
jgi:hypothetical protein